MDGFKMLCFIFIISTIALSWTDASLITNTLQMIQRRYSINAQPGAKWRGTGSPTRIKKRRNFYEDNKHKKKSEIRKKNKPPAPARKKRIDLEDYIEE